MHWGDKCLKEQIPNFSCCDFYTLPACTKISHAPYKYKCLLCIHNSFFKFKTGSWTESGKKISLTWISKHKRQVFIFFLICSWIVFVFYLCCSHFFWHLKFLSLLINFFFTSYWTNTEPPNPCLVPVISQWLRKIAASLWQHSHPHL